MPVQNLLIPALNDMDSLLYARPISQPLDVQLPNQLV